MIIDYNMSRDYCSDWGAIEALREIVQNAIDSNRDYECKINPYSIEVATNGVTLPPQVFSMGVSDKGEDSIGKYGEGFKIAMLVLTRLGLDPVILTGTYRVEGLFREHEFTGIETFCLEITDNESIVNAIQFVCKNDESLDLEELYDKIPHFTDQIPDLPTNVDVWKSKPGSVYVNGLFVTKEDLVFGYNFAPRSIKLNRDRNMVDGVHWQLAEYFGGLSSNNAEMVFYLVERDAPDVRDLQYMLSNPKLIAELSRLFYNKYGDGAQIAKAGTSYYGSGAVSCSTRSAGVYSRCGIKEAQKVVDAEAPDQVLSEWMKANKKRLRRDVRNSLSTVITQSKGWRKASSL